MSRNLGKATGATNFATVEKPVANGVTVTDGDFVKLASGRVTNATIGTGRLLGTVNGSDSTNLDSPSYRNTTVGDADGTTTVLVELATDNRYELPVSASLAADAEGSYYNLQGNTGAQEVANASKSATVGQLLCIERIATNLAGTEFKKGVFVVAQNVINADATGA